METLGAGGPVQGQSQDQPPVSGPLRRLVSGGSSEPDHGVNG